MPQERKKKETLVVLPKMGMKKRREGIDVGRALKLRIEKNLNYQEIADIFGVSAQAIQSRLAYFKPYLSDPATTKAFSEHKTSLLSVVEQELTAQMLDAKVLKKASLNNLAYSLQNIHNINRLEQGKSTENLNIRSQVGYIAGEIERLQAKEASMGIPDVVSPSDSEDASDDP